MTHKLFFKSEFRVCDLHVYLLDSVSKVALYEYQANATRRSFLRYVFHEVRVPLNSLVLGIKLLNASDHLSTDETEALTMMEESSRYMSETLNDVLSIDKIEQGAFVLNREKFSLVDMIQNSFLALKSMSISKNITLRLNGKECIRNYVYGDRYRLEHVICNLISNAIKFSPKGSSVDVDIASHEISNDYDKSVTPKEGEYYRTFVISVMDQGVGMSSEEISNIFVPFHQIRPNELQGGQGSGLGLVIAKDVIVLHGGKLECRSEVDKGTTFIITIPFLVANDTTLVAQLSKTSIEANTSESKAADRNLECLVTDGKSNQLT